MSKNNKTKISKGPLKSKATKSTKTTKSKKTKSTKTTSTVAKSDDGTIQITFTLPYSEVETKRQLVLKEIGKDIEVPGFRKGKAPIEKVAKHAQRDTVIQRTLAQILPKMVGDVIKEENLKPALYPRFELLKAVDNEPWEVRATTCELPKVTLGDYKKELKGASKSDAIWTPGKGDPTKNEDSDKPKEVSRQEKEQTVMQILLDSTKIIIPKLLIEEEANTKLSQLLEKIEKLGLNLDSYLASIGKTPQEIKLEYETQARNAIVLDLILTEIAHKDGIKIEKAEIDQAIKVASADPKVAKNADSAQQKRLIESILLRRKALDSLIALV